MQQTLKKPQKESKTKSKINLVFSVFSTMLMIYMLAHSLLSAHPDEAWLKIKLRLDEVFKKVNPLEMNRFVHQVFNDVEELVETGSSTNKLESQAFLKELREKGFAVHGGKDSDVRPLFVSAQGDFERMMAYYLNKKEITQLVGIIHTPTPATPLCTKGEISDDLVHSSMKDDKRLFTVLKRPGIIRDYLEKGGTLIAAYPTDGIYKRTEVQQEIYKGLLSKFRHNLIDRKLDTATMPWDMVGALYLFKTRHGGWGAFAIMACQANAPSDEQKWGMWFGSVSHPMIYNRVEKILQYLYEVGHFDFSNYLIK